MPDLRHWQRYSQSSFVALRRTAWHLPERVSTVGWLDTFPQMADVRKVIDADPVISARVDTMVGTEFSLQHRRLDWLLVEHLLDPIVLATRGFRFDEDMFDAHYDRLEDGLLADGIRMVEFLPLNGFISPFQQVELVEDLVLLPMTDRQMSAAIRVQGVPTEFVGTNSVEVSWLNQWALVTERAFPVVSGKYGMPDQPVAPLFPSMDEAASRLVQALRIVCGGSVITTRPVRAQHDDDLPVDLGEIAALPAIGTADLNPPTRLLSSEEIDTLQEVYRFLGDPAVLANRAQQTALRRLVFSGSRSLPEDRLVDLMISAEALFIKRAGIESRKKKRNPIVDGARTLLGDDRVLDTNPDAIRKFMLNAYKLRNAEIHGDDPTLERLTRLDGSQTNTLRDVVEDIERVMRRAMHLVLAEEVAK